MAALPGLTDERGAVPISLVGYGIFPASASGSAIVWAAPVVTIALLDCHARLHAALPGLPCHPDYRPGAWMPHVTLAEGDHPSPADALRPIVPLWTNPIHGRTDRLELVRFHPVNVLWSGALG
jgi:2'-5' RNA ligase